jgi:hypothetical protein
MFGHRACNNNNLLVSDFEPVIAISEYELTTDCFKNKFKALF